MNTVEPIRDREKVKEIYNYLKSKNPRDALMFLFGIYTGLRISDILRYRVRDCMKKGYRIREKKTNKEKIYDWNPHLKREINEYIKNKDPDEFLFKSRKGRNNPISRQRAYDIIKIACNKCEIYNVGTHTLRKTFGYYLYNLSKLNLPILMEIFNHSSERITLTYIGITQERNNKEMKKMKFF